MAQAAKKFTLALQPEAQVWLEFEAARRGTSVTQTINQAVLEQRDSAPENVKQVFEAFLETRNQ